MTKMILTAAADFFLAAGGVVSGAMLQQGEVVMPTNPVFLLAAITGSVAFWSHIKASLGVPPNERRQLN